jgi:hypothetical protein
LEAGSVEAIVRAFNANGVRYLIAGGLAVVAHGYVRFTADMDLIVDLDPTNLTQAIRALADLDYRPRAPVPLSDFAEPRNRASWVQDKGLTVFSLFSPRHPATEIDIFVEMPLDFERAYRAAARMEVASGVTATFVGFDDLLRLKQQAGRPQDRLDVEKLTALRHGSTDE